ncbi:DUF3240 family protein [Novilysobacter antarcticus]|uniref:DUF3240 family protein n=1 Tax=Novilysobacter antarcticus TaxID=2862543 RepID=UPI001C999BD7|nr:DUF3240 family protein [Lysobacter antarcticus]
MSGLIRLNMVFPPRLETPLTEALSADPSIPGYTLLEAEAHTGDFADASDAERVRGRVDRRVLWLVIRADMKDDVLRLMREHVDSGDLHWWSEPVLETGRL